MKQALKNNWIAGACLVVSLTLPSLGLAQSPSKGTSGGPAASQGVQADPHLRRYQQMQEMMKQMQDEMAKLTDQMSASGMTSESRKEMSGKLKLMSSAMSRMAGLQDRPTMGDAEAQKLITQMQRDMDAMAKGHASPSERK